MERLITLIGLILILTGCVGSEGGTYYEYSQSIEESCNCDKLQIVGKDYIDWEYHYTCINNTWNITFEALGVFGLNTTIYNDCFEVNIK